MVGSGAEWSGLMFFTFLVLSCSKKLLGSGLDDEWLTSL